MSKLFTHEELTTLLGKIWKLHSEHEKLLMKGERDEYWAGWYAAYLLGKYGDFAKFSDLVKWLQGVESSNEEWTSQAAKEILLQLG